MGFDIGKLSSLFKTDAVRVPSGDGIVGIDVGASSIKIVQLHDNKGVPTLDTYGELQVGPYDGVEIGRGVRLRPDKLIESLVDIMREASATSSQVAVALPYSASFATIVTFPTDDTDKITEMLPIEARKYVPVPLVDVSLDWFPVSAKSERKATKVLLVALHNEALTRYDGMVRGAELHAVAREIELFSAIRATTSGDDASVAIIDMGASATKLYIVQKGVLAKSHSIGLTGVDLTQVIAKTLGLDFRQAEERKRTEGIGVVTGNPSLEQSLGQVLERGFREIHTVMKRFEEEEGVTVARAVLTGGGAQLRGIIPYASDMLSVPVTSADPFAKVAYPAFLEDTLKEAGPSFSVAIGAALFGLSHTK